MSEMWDDLSASPRPVFRRLTDLPMSGRIVQFVVLARRFRCDAELCVRRIFAERFDADILGPGLHGKLGDGVRKAA